MTDGVVLTESVRCRNKRRPDLTSRASTQQALRLQIRILYPEHDEFGPSRIWARQFRGDPAHVCHLLLRFGRDRVACAETFVETLVVGQVVGVSAPAGWWPRRQVPSPPKFRPWTRSPKGLPKEGSSRGPHLRNPLVTTLVSAPSVVRNLEQHANLLWRRVTTRPRRTMRRAWHLKSRA